MLEIRLDRTAPVGGGPFFRRRLMKWVLQNFWIKLLAILMAFLLWFHVATEKEHEVDVRYRLIYESLADSLILATPPPDNIVVRCRGTGKNLLTLLFKERVWPINLTDSTPGPAWIELFAHNTPRLNIANVQFLFIAGLSSFQLDIDRLQRKTVPVVSTSTYEPRQGYLRVGPEVLSPDSAVVTGPSRVVKDIARVQARPRTFSDLTGPVDAKIKLAPFTMFNVTLNTDECRLFADVQQYGEKTIPGVPVQLPRRGRNMLSAEPRTVTVKIGGGVRVLGAADTTLVTVFPDSAALDALTFDSRPRPVGLFVDIPPEFNLIDIQPDTVHVRRQR